uniref:CSON001617 protein n=1 Tax=Culicoides sonorensis TaxID=179676 RepID=A0A336L1D8_CULSO
MIYYILLAGKLFKTIEAFIMATECEFPNCVHTASDIKINRLRIHDKLAKKWKQVFDEDLNSRIGDYLYICREHFHSSTKKLILPNPIKVSNNKEDTNVLKIEITDGIPNKRKAATDAFKRSKSWFYENDEEDEDDEVVPEKISRISEPLMPEQMFIEVETHANFVPEIKQELEEGELPGPRLEPVGKPRPDLKEELWKTVVPPTMKPNVVISSNLEKLVKTKKSQDKERYARLSKELKSLQFNLQKERRNNEVLQKDLIIAKNRIKFIESNFGGATAKQNDPDLIK